MIMRFDSEKGFKFLKENCFVITLRGAYGAVKTPIVPVKIYHKGKEAGLSGSKVFVDHFDSGDSNEVLEILNYYVRYSGFETAKEWWEEALKLSGDQHDWDIWYVHVGSV